MLQFERARISIERIFPVGRNTPIIYFVILPAVSIVTIYFFPIANYFLVVVPGVAILYSAVRSQSLTVSLKEGLEQAAIEFITVRKILTVELPAFVVAATISLIIVALIPLCLPCPPPLWDYYLFIVFQGTDVNSYLIGSAIGGLFIYLSTLLRKESRFYLARTCLMSALNKNDTFSQMYYFGLGLQEYDKYLRRRLKYQIRDIDKIFSRVSLLDKVAKADVIRNLSDSFKTGTETDELKPPKVNFVRTHEI